MYNATSVPLLIMAMLVFIVIVLAIALLESDIKDSRYKKKLEGCEYALGIYKNLYFEHRDKVSSREKLQEGVIKQLESDLKELTLKYQLSQLCKKDSKESHEDRGVLTNGSLEVG